MLLLLNQQQTNSSSHHIEEDNNNKKLPSQVACIGVLYWMINKQKVYPSVQQMLGSADSKNKMKDVIRGVCSENDSLQPERIVRKCMKELIQ